MTDDSSNNHFYIIVEQQLLQKTRNFVEVLYLLLAVHYVFNLEYEATNQSALYLLQEFVCKLKHKKVKQTAVYTAMTSHLYC